MSKLFSKTATISTAAFLQSPTIARANVAAAASVFATSRPAFFRHLPTAPTIPTTPVRSFSATSAKMGVEEITSQVQFKETLEKNDVVLVDFHAQWCGPCRVISPKVEQWSVDFPNIKYVKVDVDDQPQLAQEYGIRAMPTFLLFKKGEKEGEVVGANPPKLEQLIQANHVA